MNSNEDLLRSSLDADQNKTYDFIKEMAYLTGVGVTPKKLVEIAKKTLGMEKAATKNIAGVNIIMN